MRSSITARDIAPGDKTWLRREASQVAVSIEEFVRLLIREKRENDERRVKPSEDFTRHFGSEHGVELPTPTRAGYRLASLSVKDEG